MSNPIGFASRMFAVIAIGVAVCAMPAYAQDGGGAALRYKIYCARCHGVNGNGNGPSAKDIKNGIKPKDFADCSGMNKVSNDTMFKVIKNGGTAAGLSDQMPPWHAILTDAQISELVPYIRTFCPKQTAGASSASSGAKVKKQ